MSPLLQLILALFLFAVGLRFSFFFSGSETGFYRASFLRINIDAQAGDPIAKRLLWFARNPSAFVATTLVGNNFANYVITLSVGLGTFAVFQTNAEWADILGTLLVTPVVFIFGELLPKNLYYRAPLFLLRRNVKWLTGIYYLLLPISFPLITLSKLLEKLGQPQAEQSGLVLGKNRLAQLLSQGHREGILTDVQTRLVRGVMNAAGQPVRSSTTPSDRVLGLLEDASREEILDFARRYGIAIVPLRTAGDPDGWFGYVRVVDVAVSRKPISALVYKMPQIPANLGKLEALARLRESDLDCAVVADGPQVMGVVSAHGLIEQLFRPPHVVHALPD